MYFNINDILLLTSNDFKKYRKINKYLSNNFEPDTLGFKISVSLSLFLTIYLLIRWDFFTWNLIEEGILKTIGYFFLIIVFIGYPLLLFSLVIFGIFLYPIFRKTVQSLIRNFIINKKYISEGNIYAETERRIQDNINSYIKDRHNGLLNELSDIKIGIDRFNQMKIEYIENYSFIKTVHNYLEYRRETSIFLSKSKEIIETLVYHNPTEVTSFPSHSINENSADNFKSILKVSNELFNNPELNKNGTPLIDIIKKSLSDIENGKNDTHISHNEESDKSQKISFESQPLEKKIKLILNREEKRSTQPYTQSTTKKILTSRKLKKYISEEEKQKEKIDRLFEKAIKNVSRVNTSASQTFNINPAVVNWAEINNKRKNIGDAGELIVYNFEVEKLLKADLVELIPKIEHSSQIYGDGCGYDIKSFSKHGKELYIEVKSTEGQLRNPIYFSKNELERMKELSENYCLYRVYNLDISNKTGKITIYSGYRNIIDNFEFIPETVKAKLK